MKTALAVAAVAGVGVAAYYVYKSGAIERIDLAIKNNQKVTEDLFKNAIDVSIDDAGDFVFKEGFKFSRMTAESGIDFNKVTDATYVSFRLEDRLKYMTELKDWSGTGKRYEVVLEAAKDLKAPSRRKAEEIFKEFMSGPDGGKYRDDLRKTLTKTYEKLYHVDELRKQKAKQRVLNEIKIEIDEMMRSENLFDSAIYSIVTRSNDSKRLISEYQQKGYDMIEDYFDKGMFTSSPMIIFNASSSVKKRGEKFIDEFTKKKAIAKLRTIE